MYEYVCVRVSLCMWCAMHDMCVCLCSVCVLCSACDMCDICVVSNVGTVCVVHAMCV